jgi:hypothetical protein
MEFAVIAPAFRFVVFIVRPVASRGVNIELIEVFMVSGFISLAKMMNL